MAHGVYMLADCSGCKFPAVYIHAKNYENWLAVDKVIAKIIRLTFFGPPCTLLLKQQ